MSAPRPTVPSTAPIAEGNRQVGLHWLPFFNALAAVTWRGNNTLTTPESLRDGDVWIEATGTSPARTISLNVRDAGVTQVILTYVY